jgi:hypothetical protein
MGERVRCARDVPGQARRPVPGADRGDHAVGADWIRWYPQPVFSVASRSISAVISALTGGRPVRWR